MKWRFCGLILVGFLSPFSAFAEDTAAGTPGLAFRLLESNQYSVSKGTANTYDKIIVPRSNNGFPVVMIDNDAFYGCKELTDISIPEGVTIIGKNAFLGCGFTGVTIPGSVIAIAGGAFYHCDRLVSVTMLRPTPPKLNLMVFQAFKMNLMIHVPNLSAMSNYRTATNWSDYAQKIVAP